jgi:hypothetical protein
MGTTGIAADIRLCDVRITCRGRRDRPPDQALQLRTTETIYRHELRPVITTGTDVMDKIFI